MYLELSVTRPPLQPQRYDAVVVCIHACAYILRILDSLPRQSSVSGAKSPLNALLNVSTNFGRTLPASHPLRCRRPPGPSTTEARTVILETGTSGLRAGFAGAEVPVAVLPFNANLAAYAAHSARARTFANASRAPVGTRIRSRRSSRRCRATRAAWSRSGTASSSTGTRSSRRGRRPCSNS